MAENDDKDFLDFDVDDPLDSVEPLAAPVKQAQSKVVGDGVLLYEGKKYAVGLNWLVGDESGNNQLALKRAKDFAADFYCMRSNVVSQHGFGFLAKGHRIGMPVLASVVADVFVGEWHGIFAADNGWWYVAVHADNIAPDGDRFFASEEEAYNFFLEESKAYRWPRAYAPQGWNLSDTTSEIPLNKIIGEANPPALKPVTIDAVFSGRSNRNLAIVGGVIILILLIAGFLGQQYLPSLIPSRAQLPGPNLQVSDILQTPPDRPVLIAEQEANNLSTIPLPLPSVFIERCLTDLAVITKPLPGWVVANLRCKDSFVEGNWGRLSGSLDMVQPYLDQFPRDAVVQFTDASHLTVQRQVANEKVSPQSSTLSDRNRVMMVLNQRFAALGDFEAKDVIPTASQQLLQGIESMQQAGLDSVMQNAPVLKPLTYQDLPYVAASLSTKTPPNLLAKYFDIPGLVINEIIGDLAQGTWKYDFKVINAPEKRLVEANIKAKAIQAQQTK